MSAGSRSSGGGGGFGNPLERDPEQVLADVRAGYVSVEAAQNEYGVVLHVVDGSIGLDLGCDGTAAHTYLRRG